VFKALFAGRGLKIGRNFRCDSFPRLQLDPGASIWIADGVTFRRNVELRAHGTSRIKIGNYCRIDRGVRLLSANDSELVLEEKVRVGLYTVFNGGDSIRVGRNSLISGFVYLQTSMHKYQGEGNIQAQGYSHSPILVRDDNWIGTHAVLFPGIDLGKGCVVGSLSVVNKSFESNSVIAGIPAEIKKKR
jgi:acetyltransferase-like isoleucine patch superfamily enzyme